MIKNRTLKAFVYTLFISIFIFGFSRFNWLAIIVAYNVVILYLVIYYNSKPNKQKNES